MPLDIDIKVLEDRTSGFSLNEKDHPWSTNNDTGRVLSREGDARQFAVKRPFVVTQFRESLIKLSMVVGPGVVWGQLVPKQDYTIDKNTLSLGTARINVFVMYSPMYATQSDMGSSWQSNIIGPDPEATYVSHIEGSGNPTVDNSDIAYENRYERIAILRLTNGEWAIDDFSGLSQNILFHPPNRAA